METYPKLSFECPMKWEAMRGDERERFCEKCQRPVVNLSRLTEAQRQPLLEKARTERVCVTYEERLAAPIRPAPAPSRRRTTLFTTIGFGAIAALLVAFTPQRPAQHRSSSPVFHPEIVLRRYYDSTRRTVDEWRESVRVYFGGTPRPNPLQRRMGEIDCRWSSRITRPVPSAPPPGPSVVPQAIEPRPASAAPSN